MTVSILFLVSKNGTALGGMEHRLMDAEESVYQDSNDMIAYTPYK